MKKEKRKIMIDVSKVNWKLLVKQKLTLLNRFGGSNEVIGIINFIDSIQDQAAEIIGEEKVFGKL